MRNQSKYQELRKLISLNNYELLHQQLLRLSWRQKRAIQLRFWEEFSIFQIAHQMNISWEEADELIEAALKTLNRELRKSTETLTAMLAA